MRKILFILSLWLGLAAVAFSADTFQLVNGGAVTGDIMKFDDNGTMIHTPEDVYTNIPWARFSQDSLKTLSANPKIKGFVEPFIAPDESQRPARPEIQVNPVLRMERPANPSLLGGLFKSGLGLFILLLVYGASLLAAYEISIVKARSPASVMGVAAVLPIIGPIIFLILPMPVAKPVEHDVAEEVAATQRAAPRIPGQKVEEPIEIGDASWKGGDTREKKPEAQVYARGKFTFNKRFIETRFGAFIGAADGEQAKKFSMEVRTMKELLTIERIAQVGATEVIFETPNGQVTVALGDIQEIKLNPKTQ